MVVQDDENQRHEGTSMATERQIAANRENALRSTGPRTPEGKAAVRFNAAKHCLLAEAALLPDENPDDLRRVRDAIWKELNPQGELEAMEVDRVASCFWRLRRVIKVEAGLFVREHYGEIVRQAGSEALSYWRTEEQDRLEELFPPLSGRVTDHEAHAAAVKRRDEAQEVLNGAAGLLGAAFARDAVGANAFSKLSAYQARIERSLDKSLARLYELQAQRRHAASEEESVSADDDIAATGLENDHPGPGQLATEAA
jgi:hypothetical protein